MVQSTRNLNGRCLLLFREKWGLRLQRKNLQILKWCSKVSHGNSDKWYLFYPRLQWRSAAVKIFVECKLKYSHSKNVRMVPSFSKEKHFDLCSWYEMLHFDRVSAKVKFLAWAQGVVVQKPFVLLVPNFPCCTVTRISPHLPSKAPSRGRAALRDKPQEFHVRSRHLWALIFWKLQGKMRKRKQEGHDINEISSVCCCSKHTS